MRLQDNNVYFMHHSKNEAGVDCIYVYGKTERHTEETVISEIAIGANSVELMVKSKQNYLISLFQ
jgi:hypothetical protein